MPRVCFLLRVRPELMDEYRRRHERVWPEMMDALSQAGWRNYSLFIDGDGLVVGYVETDDFDKAQAAMEKTEVNGRWQAEMAQFFVGLDGRRPDEGMHLLSEYFHLD